MKINIIIFIALFAVLSHLEGSEPVDSYLASMVAGAGDNLWWVYPKEIDGKTIVPPKGGYIFRIKIDLNGDGVDEVFLTNEAEVMKDGESWTLYRGSVSGGFVKASSSVWLNGLLWVKTDNGVKRYSFVGPQDPDSGLESIFTFWIDGSGNFNSHTEHVTDAQSKAINDGGLKLTGTDGLPDAEKIARYLQLGTPVALTVEKVLTGKLFQNSNATWRAVNDNFTLTQQYLDPADASDIASLTTWTPPESP